MSEKPEAEAHAVRIVLERMLPFFPKADLTRWARAQARVVKHLDEGGATIPPTTEAEAAGERLALEIFEDALGRRQSFIHEPD